MRSYTDLSSVFLDGQPLHVSQTSPGEPLFSKVLLCTRHCAWSHLTIITTKLGKQHFLHKGRGVMLQLHSNISAGTSNMGPQICNHVLAQNPTGGDRQGHHLERWSEPQAEARGPVVGAGDAPKSFPWRFSKGILASSSWGTQKFPYFLHSQEQSVKVIIITATATWRTVSSSVLHVLFLVKVWKKWPHEDCANILQMGNSGLER